MIHLSPHSLADNEFASGVHCISGLSLMACLDCRQSAPACYGGHGGRRGAQTCAIAEQVTTVDQKTLKNGKEPLHTLSSFRALKHLKHKFPEAKYPSQAIFFGNLCTAIGYGVICIGDSVSAELRNGPME